MNLEQLEGTKILKMGNGGNVFFYAAKVDAEALGTDMRQHEKWNP